MLRRKLDAERHGSAGYTSITRLAAIGAMAGFLVLSVHLGVTSFYNGRILPGVSVGGSQIGGLTTAEARRVLQDKAARYRINLQIAGLSYRLNATQLGVTYDIETTLSNAYQSGRGAWLPPAYQAPLLMSYRLDRRQLNAFTTDVAAKVGTPPIDAGVVLKAGKFDTTPEKSGWTVDRIGMQRLIEDDVRSLGQANLKLNPHEQVADIQVKALGPTIEEARHLMATPIVLSFGSQTFIPMPAQIGQWLAFQKQPDGLSFKLAAQVDSAELKDYVQNIADKVNLAPVNKKVTIQNGVSKIDQDGVDGLVIDQDKTVAAIADAIKDQQALAFVIPTNTVAYKTVSTTLISLDYGQYIEVSISKQHLWVWQDHNVIYETAVTTGAAGADLGTVTGLFSIYYKTTNTHLRGQGYDVPVKYWMPFYLGYGLHDATWRNGQFGGSDYYYAGSHGCVNLPDAAAEFIYNWASVGTPVWVHN